VLIRRLLALFLFLAFIPACFSQADIKFERARARDILNIVASDVEKNFYDPTFKGLDWKAEVNKTREKIDAANNLGEIYTAIFSLIMKLDNSHTEFMPPGRTYQVNFGFNAKPVGDKILIYDVKKKGAAEAAGLKPGDQIIGVNGFQADRNSFSMMMLYYRVLRPVPVLDLIYSRDNGAPQQMKLQAKTNVKARSLDLTRSENIWSLLGEIEDDSEITYFYKMEGDIGYLKIPQFAYDDDPSFGGLFKKVANSKAIVVDLRGNPGGIIKGMAAMAGHFEPRTVVAADLISRKKTEPLTIKPVSPNLNVPMVILVDSQSFSCSELFARHFQRERRAVIVGDHTLGYATAANYYSHNVGADVIVPFGMQVATARVVFPGNEDLEKKGVTPDQVCLPSSADLREEKDPCRDKAYEIARGLLEKSGETKAAGN